MLLADLYKTLNKDAIEKLIPQNINFMKRAVSFDLGVNVGRPAINK